MNLGPQMADIRTKVLILTLEHMGTLLKNQNLENRVCHVLSWPKLRLELKFHEVETFGGFGKCEQKNKQDSCFISIDCNLIIIITLCLC